MKALSLSGIILFLVAACSPVPKESDDQASQNQSPEETGAAVHQPEVEKNHLPQLDFENFQVFEFGELEVTLPVPTYLGERDSIEPPKIELDPRALRSAGTLKLKLADGRMKEFKDNPEEGGNYITYTYIDNHTDVRQWLLLMKFYEGIGYALVDQRSGQETYIWSDPAFSPDRKYFICAMSDIEAGYDPNGIQLWEFKDDVPALVWEKRLDDWGVQNVIWTKDDYIIGEQIYRDEKLGELNTRLIKMKLTR